MNKTQFKTLYKRNTNGAINQWQIIVENNTYFTREGLLNGKLTDSTPTIAYGKNTGKKNQTTDSEQAIREAESKFKVKTEEGYFEDLNNVDNEKVFFEPMLAHKYLDYKDKIQFPVLVSTKIDGSRMIIQKSGLYTRNGKQYVSCPHIHEAFKTLFEKHPDWKIDGEIYSHEVSFEKIMSLVRKTKPTEEDIKESEEMVKIYIFDGVTENRNQGFDERFKIIRQEISKYVDSKYYKFVEATIVNSHEEIDKFHDEFVLQGYEGLMIRIPNSPYENKRSKNLLKYKHFFDEEFEIVDIAEGLGNRSGMAGNLVLKMKTGQIFSSGIRGGVEYYKHLLSNKSKYIGKMATIRYQNLSAEDKIPRFPICVDIDRGDI